MDPRAITDQHKAACNQLVTYATSEEVKTVARAILDANAWLDGLYQDIRKLTIQNGEMAAKIEALGSRVDDLERKLQRH